MKRYFFLVVASILHASAMAVDAHTAATPAAPPGKTPAPASANDGTTPVPEQPATVKQWIDVSPTPYGPMMIQRGPPPPYRDYQMSRVIPPDEKARWRQMAMPLMANMMQMDAREAMNFFAVKLKVKPGVSFDEVVQSMMVRANQVNLKLVGTNLLWKDFHQVLNDATAPRIEIFSFCDIAVARELLRIIPEMVVFLPCRIAVMEDADKNIWVMTMDWDVTWLDTAGNNRGLTPELRQGAAALRAKLDSVMRASANGDL